MVFPAKTQFPTTMESSVVEKYTALLDASPDAMIAHTISSALSDKNLFVFGELLDHPKVKSLEGEWKHALELFAYGTWKDYKSSDVSVPALNEKQEHKLKQLSVVSMCGGTRELGLREVVESLETGSGRAAEDLVISCMYAGLLEGRLNQEAGIVEVDMAVGRDVRREDLAALGDRLRAWREALEDTRRVLDATAQRAAGAAEAEVESARMAFAAATAAKAQAEEIDRAAASSRSLASRPTPFSRGGGGGGGGGGGMRRGGDGAAARRDDSTPSAAASAAAADRRRRRG